MTDGHTPVPPPGELTDEVISAVLDGEASDAERRLADEAGPEARARLEAFAEVRRAVADAPVALAPADAERMIAAALATAAPVADQPGASGEAGPPPAPVVAMGRRSNPLRWGAAAAVALAVVAGVALVTRTDRGGDDTLAVRSGESAESLADDAGGAADAAVPEAATGPAPDGATDLAADPESAEDAADGPVMALTDDGAPTTTVPGALVPPVPGQLVELGVVTSGEDLLERLAEERPGWTEPDPPDAPDPGPAERGPCPDADGEAVAVLVWLDGVDAVAHTGPDGVAVLDASSCAVLATLAWP